MTDTAAIEPTFGTREYYEYARTRFDSLPERADARLAQELRDVLDEILDNESHDYWRTGDYVVAWREGVPEMVPALEDMERAKLQGALGYAARDQEFVDRAMACVEEYEATRESGALAS